MLNKAYALSLFAAAMLISPAVAVAGAGGARQEVNQNAVVTGDNSRVNQRADQRSVQERYRQGSAYCGGRFSPQYSNQRINQNGVAIENSVVDQFARQDNLQRQTRVARSSCR